MNLAEVFAKVTVTESQGIAVLNTFAEANSDRDPELVSAINEAIAGLSNPVAKEAEKEETASTASTMSRTTAKS
jgi:hypothetical protein